jgi:hypothetical protein
MSAVIDDGKGHSPLVFQGFGLGGCGHALQIGVFKGGFVFHE